MTNKNSHVRLTVQSADIFRNFATQFSQQMKGLSNDIDSSRPSVGLHPDAAATSPTILSDWADAPGSIPTNRNNQPNGIDHLPVRKSPRATFHDYSGGDYFITICTHNKKHYFGKIINNKMHYSKIGFFADCALKKLYTHYSYVEVPLYVIMPNHVHAIIVIKDKAPDADTADASGSIPTKRSALGVVIGGYKQSVTRFAKSNGIEFKWQSRYHDHIIRGWHDGNRIADYIINNVARWNNDCYF